MTKIKNSAVLFGILAVFVFIAPFTAAADLSRDFSGKVSAANAPFRLEKNYCASGPVLMASNLKPGDILRLNSLTGHYCTRSGIGICSSNFNQGCQRSFLHGCLDGALRISLILGKNSSIEYPISQALDGIVVPRGTNSFISAFIYVKDIAGYYFDNNSAYRCSFNGTITSGN